jgi:hypothetical protein
MAQLDWMLHPALTYAVIAAGLVLCVVLFVSLKRDMLSSEVRGQKRVSALEAELAAKVELLDERWKELSQISGLLVAPAPPRSGLNVNKRSQALRLSRRGETPREIATTLAIPQNEVELLVKVQKIMLSGMDAPKARAQTSP